MKILFSNKDVVRAFRIAGIGVEIHDYKISLSCESRTEGGNIRAASGLPSGVILLATPCLLSAAVPNYLMSF